MYPLGDLHLSLLPIMQNTVQDLLNNHHSSATNLYAATSCFRKRIDCIDVPLSCGSCDLVSQPLLVVFVTCF